LTTEVRVLNPRQVEFRTLDISECEMLEQDNSPEIERVNIAVGKKLEGEISEVKKSEPQTFETSRPQKIRIQNLDGPIWEG